MQKKVWLAVMVVFLLGACANKQSANKKIETQKTYVIGIDDTFTPMSFKDSEGNIVGFDVDLAKEVGEILNIDFSFQSIDWVMKETELNAGNIDLIWNGYTITEERKQQVAFSDAYLDNKQIIITKSESDITMKADLAGKTVATQQSSSALDALNADSSGIVQKFSGGEPVLYPTFIDVFNDLDSGRSDAIVVDEVLGRFIMKEKGAESYTVLEEDFGEEEYGVGMRKEDTKLQQLINQALTQVKENQTYDTIYQKWFAE